MITFSIIIPRVVYNGKDSITIGVFFDKELTAKLTGLKKQFTPGESAINQLLSLTNEFRKALDEGKEIRVVFCNICKAFDRVWHKGLLNKLENIGIQGSLLLWINNYLTDRKQRVAI